MVMSAFCGLASDAALGGVTQASTLIWANLQVYKLRVGSDSALCPMHTRPSVDQTCATPQLLSVFF
jgi:hypothetical protein